MAFRLSVIDTISPEHSRGLVGTMPSGVSMSGADQGRRRTREELERELAEAREQQAAIAEILRVISSSPTDPHSVFEKIAPIAARLCDAYDVSIHQVEGNELCTPGHHGPIPPAGTFPLTSATPGARAVLDRQTIHIADLQTETDKFPEAGARAPASTAPVHIHAQTGAT
jgi:hypothetical protein